MMFDSLFVEDDDIIKDMTSFLVKSRIVIAEHFFSNQHKTREHLHRLEFQRIVDDLEDKAKIWNEDIDVFNLAYETLCQQLKVYEQQLRWIHQAIENGDRDYPVDIKLNEFKCNPMVLMDTYSELSRGYPRLKSDICNTNTALEIKKIMDEFETYHFNVKRYVNEHFPVISNELESLILQNQHLIDEMMAYEKQIFRKMT